MNIRLLIPFLILALLVGVIIYSLIQLAIYYLKSEKSPASKSTDDVDPTIKEQIITDLTAENERLAKELDDLKRDSHSQ